MDVEEIFRAYPRRIGKKAAEKAIVKALKEVDAAYLLGKVKAFAELTRRKKTEARFIPHPTTWFNAGRWDDEDLEPINGKAHHGAQADPEIVEALEVLVGHRTEELALEKVTQEDVDALAALMPEECIVGEQAEEFYRLRLPASRFHRPGWIKWKSQRPELLLEN